MKRSVRVGAQAILLTVFGTALAACSGTQGQGPVTCATVFYYPLLQLVYPIPNTTALPVGLTTLLYNTAPNSNLTRATVPITLQIGVGRTLATSAIPVPNPTPSPAATPAYPNSSLAAVALPKLSAATTYQVFATQYQGGCSPPSGKTIQTNIGSFTTVGTSPPQ